MRAMVKAKFEESSFEDRAEFGNTLELQKDAKNRKNWNRVVLRNMIADENIKF